MAHLKSLAKEIVPFKFKKTPIDKETNIIWSYDCNVAKSIALEKASICNSPVKKLTLSQAISVILDSQEVEADVYFIEYSKKMQGDMDKIKSVLTSFIDRVTMQGASVIVYVAPQFSTFKLDYCRK